MPPPSPIGQRSAGGVMAIVDGLLFTLTFVTALGCGLIAGLFFAFSVAVMQALARLPAAGGIAAMQSINSAILNPLSRGFFGNGGWLRPGDNYCSGALALSRLRVPPRRRCALS